MHHYRNLSGHYKRSYSSCLRTCSLGRALGALAFIGRVQLLFQNRGAWRAKAPDSWVKIQHSQVCSGSNPSQTWVRLHIRETPAQLGTVYWGEHSKSWLLWQFITRTTWFCAHATLIISFCPCFEICCHVKHKCYGNLILYISACFQKRMHPAFACLFVCLINWLIGFAVLGIKPRTLHLLGKCFSAKPHYQLMFVTLISVLIIKSWKGMLK